MHMPMKKRRTATAQLAPRRPLLEVSGKLVEQARRPNQRAHRRPRQDAADRAWPRARGASARPGQLIHPILIPKHEQRFTEFDDRIIVTYCPKPEPTRDPSVSSLGVLRSRPTSSARSPMRSWPRRLHGKTVLWRRCTWWRSSPHCKSRSATTAGAATRRRIWHWAQADDQREVLGRQTEQTEGGKAQTQGLQRDQDPKVPGHSPRHGRRLEGPDRNHRHGLPAHDGATCIMHPTHNSQLRKWENRKAGTAALRLIYAAASS